MDLVAHPVGATLKQQIGNDLFITQTIGKNNKIRTVYLSIRLKYKKSPLICSLLMGIGMVCFKQTFSI